MVIPKKTILSFKENIHYNLELEIDNLVLMNCLPFPPLALKPLSLF